MWLLYKYCCLATLKLLVTLEEPQHMHLVHCKGYQVVEAKQQEPLRLEQV